MQFLKYSFRFAYYTVQNKKMEEFLTRLSDLILLEMKKRDLSYQHFADICMVHRNEISDIVNRKIKDIKLSTVFKICENTDISFCVLLNCKEKEIQKLEKDILSSYILTNGITSYHLIK